MVFDLCNLLPLSVMMPVLFSGIPEGSVANETTDPCSLMIPIQIVHMATGAMEGKNVEKARYGFQYFSHIFVYAPPGCYPTVPQLTM